MQAIFILSWEQKENYILCQYTCNDAFFVKITLSLDMLNLQYSYVKEMAETTPVAH